MFRAQSCQISVFLFDRRSLFVLTRVHTGQDVSVFKDIDHSYMPVYAAFNYCISHVELGEVYIIPGLFIRNPAKGNMYELFILTASRLEFRSCMYIIGQMLLLMLWH